MSIVCAADLQVGAGAAHRRDPLADQERILDQIDDLARGCDGVLLAGDIFHRPKPTPAELHLFARFVRRLSVPAVAVVGNTGHDLTNGDEPSALELFDDRPRFFVSRTPEVVMVAGVAVCTLPSTPVHRLVAQGDTDRGPVNEVAADLLVRTADDLRAQVPDGTPAVLLGHWAVSGASLPNGLPAEELREPVLDTLALAGQRWDAMVFGHLHRPQEIGREVMPVYPGTSDPPSFDPIVMSAAGAPVTSGKAKGASCLPLAASPVFYCGSPMTMDFGEAGFEHGVWILTLTEPETDRPGGIDGRLPSVGDPQAGVAAGSSGSVSVEFVPLDDRAFVTVDVDLAAREVHGLAEYGADETDRIAAAVTEHFPLTEAVVRVTYRATEEQHRRVDQGAIRSRLADAGVHRVTQIAWEPVRQARARVEGVDETVGVDEAVRAWCAANGCEERAGALIEWAAA